MTKFFESNDVTRSIDHETLVLPQSLVDHLNKYIIGQDQAKKILSVACFNIGLRKLNETAEIKELKGDFPLSRNNILMIGPTGCGKTFLIQTLSKHCKVPVAIEDATTFTSVGYVGRDLNGILGKLIDNAYEYVYYSGKYNTFEERQSQEFINDVKQCAEYGIIYIDEIDKIAGNPDESNKSSNKDITGLVIQEELLKMIEGDIIHLKRRNEDSPYKYYNSLNIDEIDTSNILFILGGAFVPLKTIIDKRLGAHSIGFHASLNRKFKEKNVLKQVNTDDLTTFGFLPELIGRVPTIAVLDPLTEKTLLTILKNDNDSIIQKYIHIFNLYGRKLIFTKQALKQIAKVAIKLNIGARGLHSIIEKSLLEHQFNAPNNPNGPDIIIRAKDILE